MLVAIYKARGYELILKWVDDFLVIRLPHQSFTEQQFMEITAALGVPWSLAKVRYFASTQRFIGLDWDLQALTVALPLEKLAAIRSLIGEWLQPGRRATRQQAASLHGKLVYAATIFPLIRPFVRTAGRFAERFESHRAALAAPSTLQADLRWISELLDILPNSLPLAHPEPVDIGWWGDASSSFGIGVVVGRFWAVWRYAAGVTVGPRKRFDIGWAEALAVELGLALARHHGILDTLDRHQSRILVRSDNMGVVHIINNGRSRSSAANQVLKRIYAALAEQRRSLRAVYITSEENAADALSRGDISGFLAKFPQATLRSDFLLPPSLQDLLVSWPSPQ